MAGPDIDTVMVLGSAEHPRGGLGLSDLVGLDVRLGTAEYLAGELGDRFEPRRWVRQVVAEGKLRKIRHPHDLADTVNPLHAGVDG